MRLSPNINTALSNILNPVRIKRGEEYGWLAGSFYFVMLSRKNQKIRLSVLLEVNCQRNSVETDAEKEEG
jgi:hypothetical protein